MPEQSFSIRLCNWAEARPEARRIRELVFVREQGVPLELEWDEQDPRCDHALAYAADDLSIWVASSLTICVSGSASSRASRSR